MTAMLHRLQHLLIIATGMAAVVLAGMWSPWAGGALMMVEGLAFMVAYKRGFFTVPVTHEPETQDPQTAARTMVTHFLKGLTRVQVAYLCREFSSRPESRSWLKKYLPKAFHGSLDELHRNLELARQGSQVESLKLAQRIMARRDHIRRLEQDLEQASQEHTCPVAHPMFFVVTEHLDTDEKTEPGVEIMVGWNPSEQTLLPRVDGIAFYSDLDAGKKIRGRAEFDEVLAAMPHVEPVEPGATFLARPVDDPTRLAVRLDVLPMGFTVDAGDMLE